MRNMRFLFTMILSVIALNSCTDTSGLENQIDNKKIYTSESENLIPIL